MLLPHSSMLSSLQHFFLFDDDRGLLSRRACKHVLKIFDEASLMFDEKRRRVKLAEARTAAEQDVTKRVNRMKQVGASF